MVYRTTVIPATNERFTYLVECFLACNWVTLINNTKDLLYDRESKRLLCLLSQLLKEEIVLEFRRKGIRVDVLDPDVLMEFTMIKKLLGYQMKPGT